MRSTNGLLLRAVVAFIALPGTIAILLPLVIFRPDDRPFHPSGIIPLVLGTALLLWCVRDFYVAGKGTLAPWTPPRHLVAVGLYRCSRNPMYIAVMMMLIGWALGFRSPGMWGYTAGMAVAFHLRVVAAEEPFLARTHGEEWTRYRARVPRWLFRFS
jgi:protein-S-isoprenylcysteine O-methyltransferase Ste14